MESEPIRAISDINAIHRVLTKWDYVREAECFIIGCNFALRVGDLLKLTIEQVKEDKIKINEQKTGKVRELPINQSARQAINRLIAWYELKNIKPTYLFQPTGNRAKNVSKPISTKHLNNRLKQAAEAIGLDCSISSHSMRKSMGFHAYNKGVDVRNLQVLFNHKTEFQTLTYIGVTKRTVNDVYMSSELGIEIL